MRITHTIVTFIIILNKGTDITAHHNPEYAYHLIFLQSIFLNYNDPRKWQDRDREIMSLHISLKFAIFYINFGFNIASSFSKKQQNTRERERERENAALLLCKRAETLCALGGDIF